MAVLRDLVPNLTINITDIQSIKASLDRLRIQIPIRILPTLLRCVKELVIDNNLIGDQFDNIVRAMVEILQRHRCAATVGLRGRGWNDTPEEVRTELVPDLIENLQVEQNYALTRLADPDVASTFVDQEFYHEYRTRTHRAFQSIIEELELIL